PTKRSPGRPRLPFGKIHGPFRLPPALHKLSQCNRKSRKFSLRHTAMHSPDSPETPARLDSPPMPFCIVFARTLAVLAKGERPQKCLACRCSLRRCESDESSVSPELHHNYPSARTTMAGVRTRRPASQSSRGASPARQAASLERSRPFHKERPVRSNIGDRFRHRKQPTPWMQWPSECLGLRARMLWQDFDAQGRKTNPECGTFPTPPAPPQAEGHIASFPDSTKREHPLDSSPRHVAKRQSILGGTENSNPRQPLTHSRNI